SIPSLSVGGDFIDFYRYSDFIVDVIIADVMGKGMIASMLGAASKSAFMKSRLDLSVLENDIPSINKIMTLTNQTLSPELIKMGKFITMQDGRLNMKTSLFSFIDSGHTSLLYYSARQKCCWSLKGWNMPLGFNPREDLISSIIPFERNDLFFFYSDGVTETANDEGELFGEKRLNYVINSSAHLTSSQIMNKVRNLVFHYSSAEGFADDVTCIAMKIGGIEQNFSRTETIFPGIRESLSDIRKYVTDFFHKNFKNLDDDLIHSIVLAVNEGAANIIEHNYEKHPERNGREILIETGYNSSVCFFKLFYDGEDFEWTIFEAPELNELKSGGYGLFLMKEIMDSISYSTNIYGVQCLSLLKYLPLP
ncbi:MAG: SpoIIE family protein phosphatase, partial [Spirochaetaceae bacterium]|nr:SpoIIE family protein phosphatase [Spirochaetaceae bacterium]